MWHFFLLLFVLNLSSSSFWKQWKIFKVLGKEKSYNITFPKTLFLHVSKILNILYIIFIILHWKTLFLLWNFSMLNYLIIRDFPGVSFELNWKKLNFSCITFIILHWKTVFIFWSFSILNYLIIRAFIGVRFELNWNILNFL